jgi:hypothetical protein
MRQVIDGWVRAALPDVPWPHRPGEPTYVTSTLYPWGVSVSLERWTDESAL